MTEYKYTFWNHDEWFRSECWCDAGKTAAKFPQCVSKAVELGTTLIRQKKQQMVWNEAHPDEFKNFEKLNIPTHRGTFGTKEQEDCVEYFLAYDIFTNWYRETDEWKKAMNGTQRQIEAYYKDLASDPTKLTDTKDSSTDAHLQWRLDKKVKEATRLSRS